MPEGTILMDRVYFDKPEWRDQKNARDGFSPGAAWVDLLALCNQRPTTFEAQGTPVDVARGQCGWSKLALAERWGWSQGKVSARLMAWEKDGRVTVDSNSRRTLITVVNYDAYQTGLLSNENQLRTNREPTGTEKGEERRELLYQGEKREERGGDEPHLPELPSDELILKFGQDWPGEPASGTPAMPVDWVNDFLRRLNGRREFPRDWKRLMISTWRAEHREFNKKNAAAGTAPGKVSASVTLIQLEKDLKSLEDEIEQDRQCNMPRDAKKTARAKEMRAQLARLKP